ncbi:hypothetical protein DRH14_03415, partial [Candidatus Shapirobacteria bacterium]
IFFSLVIGYLFVHVYYSSRGISLEYAILQLRKIKKTGEIFMSKKVITILALVALLLSIYPFSVGAENKLTTAFNDFLTNHGLSKSFVGLELLTALGLSIFLIWKIRKIKFNETWLKPCIIFILVISILSSLFWLCFIFVFFLQITY